MPPCIKSWVPNIFAKSRYVSQSRNIFVVGSVEAYFSDQGRNTIRYSLDFILKLCVLQFLQKSNYSPAVSYLLF